MFRHIVRNWPGTIGALANFTDASGLSPCHHAVMAGCDLSIIATDAAGFGLDVPSAIGAKWLSGSIAACQMHCYLRSNPDITSELIANLPMATPLGLAAYQGSSFIMHVLLERRADIHSQNIYRRTPLILAAMHGHGGAVKLLLSAGAKTTAADSWGRTAAAWALQRNHNHLAELLGGVVLGRMSACRHRFRGGRTWASCLCAGDDMCDDSARANSTGEAMQVAIYTSRAKGVLQNDESFIVTEVSSKDCAEHFIDATRPYPRIEDSPDNGHDLQEESAHAAGDVSLRCSSTAARKASTSPSRLRSQRNATPAIFGSYENAFLDATELYNFDAGLSPRGPVLSQNQSDIDDFANHLGVTV